MAKRILFFLLFRPPNAIPTKPSTGKIRAAYSGDFLVAPVFWAAKALCPLPEVFTVMVTVPLADVATGLKVHEAPTGKPVQPKVIMPRVESSSSRSKTNVAGLPAFTVAVAACGVMTIGGPRRAVSMAVSFEVLVSPPPETVAVLKKLFPIPRPIFVVSVITG